MTDLSGGEIALMVVLGLVVSTALAGTVATGVPGMRRLPGRRDETPEVDGRTAQLATRAATWRRDRTTPALLLVAYLGLSGLVAGLLAWGDGLDLWAYVIMVAALAVVWLASVAAIGHSGAAPEAEPVDLEG